MNLKIVDNKVNINFQKHAKMLLPWKYHSTWKINGYTKVAEFFGVSFNIENSMNV